MEKRQIGVVGMSVMGSNLCLNLERNGFFVSIFNRSFEKAKKIVLDNPNKNIFCFEKIKDFVNFIKTPRCILLMVKSGKVTDKTIELIIPHLNKNDIIVDCGNSFYKDTILREKYLNKIGINFIGAGISGGEKGALFGPSIMPGGNKKVYNSIKNIFFKISANYKGVSCVDYIGPNGSGHYVKMIHNAIEYGDMQIISESYSLLKNLLKLDNYEISEIFKKWNKGELNSYLIEITKYIFLKKDSSGKYLIDLISDVAKNKGTGKWASINSLEIESPLSLITESVFYRYISSLKMERTCASDILKGPVIDFSCKEKNFFIEELRKSLYFSKIISYAQGFSQMHLASKLNNWNLNYKNIAKIFRAGCIIRAKFLDKIMLAYEKKSNLNNLLLDDYFTKITFSYQNSLRNILSTSIKYGIPVPALSSAISYYDSYRSKRLSSNLIQAQRDFFGSHTYERIDMDGNFHTNWK
ncbi:NADP-dependent phosphogluconate dehydrogenase [Buchnera aphidicola (Ceratoglyphina bambusae)]|uniref:NADP-dependent phosphogluconate dehydrogenase n=1 Tax=Buchnera aphidicola TaxID=9 RepID=UPI0031B885C7